MQLADKCAPLRMACVLLSLLWTPFPVFAQTELTIGVSILPQKYFVERIAGNRAHVIVMVGPGHSPATYEPKPKQLSQLSNADLFFLIGVPFEEKWSHLFSQVNPRMKVVSLATGLNLRKMESHIFDQAEGDIPGHQHTEVWDPHFWLNPRLVEQLAMVIKTELVRVDPANQSNYEANYKEFIKDLKTLDMYIRQQLSGISHKYFLVFHPSWGYYADEYGLVQVPIEYQGKQPGARTLSKIMNMAKEKNIKVLFVQQQFSERDAKTIAKQLAVRIVRVDPLSEEYINNLEKVTRLFAEAMR